MCSFLGPDQGRHAGINAWKDGRRKRKSEKMQSAQHPLVALHSEQCYNYVVVIALEVSKYERWYNSKEICWKEKNNTQVTRKKYQTSERIKERNFLLFMYMCVCPFKEAIIEALSCNPSYLGG